MRLGPISCDKIHADIQRGLESGKDAKDMELPAHRAADAKNFLKKTLKTVMDNFKTVNFNRWQTT